MSKGHDGDVSEPDASGGAVDGGAAAPKSFEQAAERLSAIVEQLESDELTLERALALFEEGITVNRQAQARLDEAEKRVEELLSVDAQGQTRTRDFDTSAG